MTRAAFEDPILLELVRYSLDAIADEMSLVLVRTAYSINLKSTMDMCCAICDADGRLIVQGLTLPLHLGSIPEAMRATIAKFRGRVEEGDLFILNDPFEGGSHLPDIFLLKAIFLEGRHIAWAVSEGHHLDVGGMTPGGNGCDATEIYQEGIRLPPMKLMSRGKPVDQVFDFISANVRVPRHVLGDLRAQIAACETGERQYLQLVARHGFETLSRCIEALLDQSERYARAAISAMPDGTYEFVDHIDDDGMGSGPIPIKVAITVAGDRLRADFKGTSPQVRGAINSPLSFTTSAVYATVRHLIPNNIPNNEGFFRPIEIDAPPGTVVNAAMPAAVAARGLTGFRLANVLFGALAKIAPDRIFACEVGGDTGICFGGKDPKGSPFVFLEFLSGSWGARPRLDGIDACGSSVVNFSNNPVEVVEWEYPLMVERYAYVPDSGGAGQFRGGLALERQYRFLVDDGHLQLRTDRSRFQPYGLAGGRPGTPSRNLLSHDGDVQELPGKCTMTVRNGYVFQHFLAGAGGWGDPLQRDPALIREDLLDGKITPEFARREHGVEVSLGGDGTTLAVFRRR
jgi:N-methylhydantoinase B